MMQFGVCGGPELARIARDAGYDYFEWSVVGLLRPREPEAAFEAALAEARAAGLPFPAVNVFLPGDLKVTGPAVDSDALRDYAATALRRAQVAGLEVIVFGAGAARAIPEGFDPVKGRQQMVDFCRWLGPQVEKYGVTIAIEPLNRTETNLIHTAEEAARLVREVDHPNLRMLIDGYHWAKDGNTAQGIIDSAGLIVHAHVAEPTGRHAPGPSQPCAPFFDVLRQAGYSGRLSFEGNLVDPQTELPLALETMRAQLG
jgi:sugar phosphate isomerase/epimerase